MTNTTTCPIKTANTIIKSLPSLDGPGVSSSSSSRIVGDAGHVLVEGDMKEEVKGRSMTTSIASMKERKGDVGERMKKPSMYPVDYC